MILLTIGFLILLTAPWFFMMARLKNMGYTRKDIKRFFDDFGPVVGTMTLTSLVVGVVSDVLFNVIVGSFVFGRRWYIPELPREFLFTQRVKRHAANYDDEIANGVRTSRQSETGELWRNRLNRIMPDHV